MRVTLSSRCRRCWRRTGHEGILLPAELRRLDRMLKRVRAGFMYEGDSHSEKDAAAVLAAHRA